MRHGKHVKKKSKYYYGKSKIESNEEIDMSWNRAS